MRFHPSPPLKKQPHLEIKYRITFYIKSIPDLPSLRSPTTPFATTPVYWETIRDVLEGINAM